MDRMKLYITDFDVTTIKRIAEHYGLKNRRLADIYQCNKGLFNKYDAFKATRPFIENMLNSNSADEIFIGTSKSDIGEKIRITINITTLFTPTGVSKLLKLYYKNLPTTFEEEQNSTIEESCTPNSEDDLVTILTTEQKQELSELKENNYVNIYKKMFNAAINEYSKISNKPFDYEIFFKIIKNKLNINPVEKVREQIVDLIVSNITSDEWSLIIPSLINICNDSYIEDKHSL